MKYLTIKNRSSSPLYFVFCTISHCRCDVCEEWFGCESQPIANWPDATYGSLCVDGFSERVDRFCPRWDCVGAVYFGFVPKTVSKQSLFDFDEGKNYTVGNGHGELSFTGYAPDVSRMKNGRVGRGLSLIGTAGQIGLALVGVSDGGSIGGIVSLFSAWFGGDE